jgi:hypothetical protein
MSQARAELDAELALEERCAVMAAAGVDHDPATGEYMPIRTQVLRRAEELVTGPRADEYGPPDQSFRRIADGWTWHLRNRGLLSPDQALEPVDVATLMELLKIARSANDPGHADSYVDRAGYASCAAEVAAAKPGA